MPKAGFSTRSCALKHRLVFRLNVIFAKLFCIMADSNYTQKKLSSLFPGRKPDFRDTTRIYDCLTAATSISTSVKLPVYPDGDNVRHHVAAYRILQNNGFFQCAAPRGIHQKFHTRLSSAGCFLSAYPSDYLFFSSPLLITASIQKEHLFVKPLFL